MKQKTSMHSYKHMKEKHFNEKSDEIESLAKDVVEIISHTQGIYDSAYTHYLIETKHIINKTMVAPNEIESLLDYVLTFCDDDRFVYLYKRLCQKLYRYDPQASIDYINIFKKLFVEENYPE